MSGPKKSAILVWCDYPATQYQRHGGRNDVKIIEEILPTFGFLRKNITTLIQPTKANIDDALNNMKIKAGIGDVLCFYFSGLVMNQPDNNPAIYSSDGQFIPATDFQSLAGELPGQTSFTLILESSNSAVFIDPVDANDKRILFSACRAIETAKRVVPDVDNADAYGMFTHAIKKALPNGPPTATPITNEGLLRELLKAPIDSYNQHATLCCSDNNRNAPFLGYVG